jgi:hypothetical protein
MYADRRGGRQVSRRGEGQVFRRGEGQASRRGEGQVSRRGEGQVSRARLPSLSLPLSAQLQINLEKSRPEATGTLRIVRGKLDQGE